MQNIEQPKTQDATPEAPAQPINSASTETPRNQPNEIKSVTNSTESVAPETSTDDTKEEVKDPDSPDWFMKDKFKTVDDQAKSYKELYSKVGKYWGSPQEGYSVDGMDGIEANDPLITNITPALKELGISQDGFKHLVGQYMEANKAMMAEMEAELKKTLTTTDAHTYQAITKWMDDSMTPQEAAQIKNNWLMTAEDFHLFNNIRLMLAPNTSVPSAQTTPVKFESAKEVTNEKIKYKMELKEGKRVKDKNFENELASRFRDAAARELRNKGR